jgi:hypothetical protein
MKVKQLIKKLNELVEANPDNADLEIKWYDDSTGRISHGDGWPIQLFQNIYTKEIHCILNAVHNPVAFGLKPILNNGDKETGIC